MTLLEIKNAVAAYHTVPGSGTQVTPNDLTVNGIDLFLVAANQAKQSASQLHDFGFQRKLLTLAVNSATGGSLDDAVIFGTTTPATVKTVLDVGLFDIQGNFSPVEWTTAEESQGRQRQEQRYRDFPYRYPTDAQYYSCSWWGERRLTFRGDNLFLWPLQTANPQTLNVGIECYVAEEDWMPISLVTITTTVPGAAGVYYATSSDETEFEPLTGSWTLIYDNLNGDWFLNNGSGNVNGLVSGTLTGTYTGAGTFSGQSAIGVYGSGVGPISDYWTTTGQQYILWQTICDLNKYFKSFVTRQEGNIGEPQERAATALQAMINNDVFKYEQARTHGR